MLTTKRSKTVVGAIVRNKPVSISKKIYFMNPEEITKCKKPERKRRRKAEMDSDDDDDDDCFTVGKPQPKTSRRSQQKEASTVNQFTGVRSALLSSLQEHRGVGRVTG